MPFLRIPTSQSNDKACLFPPACVHLTKVLTTEHTFFKTVLDLHEKYDLAVRSPRDPNPAITRYHLTSCTRSTT